MQHDEEKFLDLLQPYVSEDTKRARRILIFISFIVVSLSFLNLSVSSFKLLGVNLSNLSEVKVQIITLIILVFWAVILYLNLKRDTAVQKEKNIHLEARLSPIHLVIERQEKRKIDNPTSTFVAQDYQVCVNALEAYNNQKDRTENLSFLQNILMVTGVYLPFALYVISSLILIVGVIKAL